MDIDMVILDNTFRLSKSILPNKKIDYDFFFTKEMRRTYKVIRGALKGLNIIRKKYKICFLTSRPIKTSSFTYECLKTKKLITKTENIKFVSNRLKKIGVLKRWKKKTFIFVDDLKYNYQSGEAQDDIELIGKLKKNDIKYHKFESWRELIKTYF